MLTNSEQDESWKRIYQKSLELFGRLTSQVRWKMFELSNFSFVYLGDERCRHLGILQWFMSIKTRWNIDRMGYKSKQRRSRWNFYFFSLRFFNNCNVLIVVQSVKHHHGKMKSKRSITLFICRINWQKVCHNFHLFWSKKIHHHFIFN